MSSVIIYRVKKNCRVNGATGVFTWSNDTSCDYTSTPEDVHRFLSLVQRLAVSFANFFSSRGRARAAIRRRRSDEEEGETGTSQKRQSRVHKSPCSRPKKKKSARKEKLKASRNPPEEEIFPPVRILPCVPFSTSPRFLPLCPPFFLSFRPSFLSAALWFSVCVRCPNNRIPTTKREASSGKRHSLGACYAI